jgi:ankyrin repeat protein
LLIEHSANIDAQGGYFGHALQAASFNGHMNIVQLLIEQGADVNVEGGKYDTALKAALYRGTARHWQLVMDDDNTLIQRLENIAQLLRDNGAHEDPDVLPDNNHGQQSTNGEYFLWWLKTGTDVNCRIT